MKKLLLISILALNYNVVQAAVDVTGEFKKAPPPKNDAEVAYLNHVKNITAVQLLAIESVVCLERSQNYLISITNALLQLSLERANELLEKSPTSRDYIWQLADVNEKLTQNPRFTKEDCVNFHNKGLSYTDEIYQSLSKPY